MIMLLASLPPKRKTTTSALYAGSMLDDALAVLSPKRSKAERKPEAPRPSAPVRRKERREIDMASPLDLELGGRRDEIEGALLHRVSRDRRERGGERVAHR